jgi:hypothetical protein
MKSGAGDVARIVSARAQAFDEAHRVPEKERLTFLERACEADTKPTRLWPA